MNLRTEIKIELWNAISKSYEAGSYSNSILDAMHYLSNVLRERANIDGDGASLIGQALGGDNPRLRVNRFQTESEKTEQKGLEQIMRGMYQGIRNPRSHEQSEDDQATANAIILFIDYILGIITQAKEPFVLEEWSKRVFDPDFVADQRYAKLLLSEVPPKKYVDAIITIYREKMSGDGEKLKYIFYPLIERMDADQRKDFLAVVSDELKTTQQELVIKMVLQILPAKFWEEINEAARLRIENKLIQSIKLGEVWSDRKENPGWLATWSRSFIQYFVLRNEALSAIVEKLKGSEAEQNYVAKFFMWELPNIVEKAPDWVRESQRANLTSIIVRDVSDVFGSDMLREKLLEFISTFPPEWQKLIMNGLKPLENESSEYYNQLIKAQEEDIPF